MCGLLIDASVFIRKLREGIEMHNGRLFAYLKTIKDHLYRVFEVFLFSNPSKPSLSFRSLFHPESISNKDIRITYSINDFIGKKDTII